MENRKRVRKQSALSRALKKLTEKRALLEPKFKWCRKKGFLWRNAWLCFEMVLKTNVVGSKEGGR